MSLVKPDNIEELIISELATKSMNGTELLIRTKSLKPSFTKQALYQLLRKLIDREVVVKHGKQFSLSQIWITQMTELFTVASKIYDVEGQGTDFLSLADGDKITYSFKSPVEADKFWGHAFNILGRLLGGREPAYIYNPHEWFFFARKESEVFLFEELKKRNQQVWLICGGATELDKYPGRYFDGSVLQYYMSQTEIFEARNYYLNIFGDYIIEAHIDETVAKKVDELYENKTNPDEQFIKRLESLLDTGKTTIRISRNKKKSDKLKRLFVPYFYKI